MTHDTNLGGVARTFPTTVWSDILAAANPNSPQYRECLDRLFRVYWKPVYAYVRAAWRKSNEDAKDLTQAFFTHLLEKDTMARLRPERGSFRGYVKIALSHFLIDADRHESVRRPKGPVFHLDAREAELDRIEPAAPGDTPEKVYDREWFRSVLDRAVDDLRIELVQEGKATWFDIFRMYCLEPGGLASGTRETVVMGDETPGITYDLVARRFGVSETQVRHYLAHCRGALRRLLRKRVREYTAREEDVDPELQAVLKG
jgi:RNA polymerase sigma-70 factor (ECF subfamily)